ncbi:MAG: UDP-N-acetylmuramate dehydrogenase [Chloroflexi bacterium]|nr:UDP-N-acetylmuramate dehydrogenase [Chloroflexota bacterium]
MGSRAQTNVPLAPRVTLRVGGVAELFVEAKTIAELIECVQLAREHAVPFFILGNGSNILVRDGGIRGLTIENQCAEFSLDVTDSILSVESGASLPGIANRLARQGWSGLEWAIGIPGTFGGAIVGNAGAHGGTMADNLLRVTILDANGDVLELPKTNCAFEYRASRFKRAGGEIVLRAQIEMTRDDPQVCIARMNQYTEHRRRTQPTEPSVGSMFKNPPGDPSAPLRASFAGQLIEQAGLKGARIGNVAVSRVHANFFVNLGGATARDVLQLVDLVRDQVREQFGIELELEIQVVGEE